MPVRAQVRSVHAPGHRVEADRYGTPIVTGASRSERRHAEARAAERFGRVATRNTAVAELLVVDELTRFTVTNRADRRRDRSREQVLASPLRGLVAPGPGVRRGTVARITRRNGAAAGRVWALHGI